MLKSTIDTGLGWYLNHIKATPLLTAEQEQQLSRRIREHGDFIAREQMINANLRLVVKVAKEYSNPSMTLTDLAAEGNLGLVRAVEEFDPDAGVRFSTYAVWWIHQAIRRALIIQGQPIHIPAYLVKLVRKWKRTANDLENKLNRPPTNQEMAKALKISQKRADIIQEGLKAVNAPTQMGSDDSIAIEQMVADNESSLPEYSLLQAGTSPMVHKLLSKLPERERKILELRFGFNEKQKKMRTFKEIGKIIGLTRERVRQLEKKAIKDLRNIGQSML